jgi:tetratricopeptide (TPR) repeat protein/DNA-binding XRE family transcriptional regulator
MPEARLRRSPAAPLQGPGLARSGGRRGRRLGVAIKPGSVKQARAEAGLSLGQVARDDISRTAIYFVETGKAKPSIETLKLIAERTGKPLDYFLLEPGTSAQTMSATVAEVQRQVATRDFTGAVSAGETILQRKLDPESLAMISYLVSTALLNLAQPVKGRRYASAARAHFERTGDLLMVAECLGNEASAAFLMQDPSALAIAEAAVSTVRALDPAPKNTEARLLATLGHVHVANQNWQAAIDLYQEAIEVGDAVRDLHRLAIVYNNISIAYQESGQFRRAAQFSQQSVTLHETLNDQINIARAENNLALVLLRMGDLAGSRAHLERALRLQDEFGVELGKSNIVLSLSELLFAEGKLAEAAELARQGRALAASHSETTTLATAHMWLGKIAEAQGEHDAADDEFAAAISTLTGTGFQEPLRHIHVVYADVLEQRGDLANANRHLKRALATPGSATLAAATLRSATA